MKPNLKNTKWVIEIDDAGVQMTRWFNGQRNEIYAKVDHAKGAVHLAAVVNGFEPSRRLIEQDEPFGARETDSDLARLHIDTLALELKLAKMRNPLAAAEAESQAIRPPYATRPYPCTCGAESKDACRCFRKDCTNLVRPPYSTRLVPACSEEAKNLRSSSINANSCSACSGFAASPNTLTADSQAGLSVSATVDTASVANGGASRDLSATVSQTSSASDACSESMQIPPCH